MTTIDPKVNSENSIKEGSRLENFSRQQWDIELAVGLTGAFLCSKVFATEMGASGNPGVILNIASDLSVISPDQRLYRKPGLGLEFQSIKPVTYSVIKSFVEGNKRTSLATSDVFYS